MADREARLVAQLGQLLDVDARRDAFAVEAVLGPRTTGRRLESVNGDVAPPLR